MSTVKRYWVDPVELMDTERYNEPDVMSGAEAATVVFAFDYDALQLRVAYLRGILKEIVDCDELGDAITYARAALETQGKSHE
jgi:hypothetical protein